VTDSNNLTAASSSIHKC